MANAKICDRCNAVIADNDKDNEYYKVSISAKRYINNNEYSHLCMSCGAEMVEVYSRFLKTPTNKQVENFNKSIDDSLGNIGGGDK